MKREDLYFATKCNPLGTGGTVGKQGKWKKHAFDADRLRASCEASLSRLQCDYIDLYMLHFPSRMGGEAFGWANWKDGRYDAARTSTGAELCGNQPVCRVHFSAMTWPRWFRRAARNRHHHAIEQGSRRWRRGRRDDSARTRRELLISTQVVRSELRRESLVRPRDCCPRRRVTGNTKLARGAVLPGGREAIVGRPAGRRAGVRTSFGVAAGDD